MRRTSFDNHISTKRNVVSSNKAYNFSSSSSSNYKNNGEYKCVSFNLQEKNNYLQRSVSADNVVIRSRGFKPSDRHDPVKRNFLENLTSKILHFDMESGERTPISLQKLLTPATDSNELHHARNKKMFASSYFYAPTHPTVEDQVELARRISNSLSDVKNMKSKGQSMYVNRKKRSVKWIHDGNGIETEEEPASPVHKDKLALKCVMNPSGKVLDIHGIQALGEEVNISPVPSNPEKLFDIVRDLNNHRGRGAEIFAKRRKRSEKWVIDKDQCQTPTTPSGLKAPTFPNKQFQSNENSNFSNLPPVTPISAFDSKPFYNPFTADISLGNGNPPQPFGFANSQYNKNINEYNGGRATEVRKIYLREVAVGTDTADEYPIEKSSSRSVEKSRRVSFDNGYAPIVQPATNHRSNHKPLVTNNYNNNNNINNIQIQQGSVYNVNKQIPMRNGNGYRYQDQDEIEVPEDADDYTPVPVKQLIQEFEKTCRPVMQYKQISPRVIPIVQQLPLDNDISRFFEQRNRNSTCKYQEQVGYRLPDNMNGNCYLQETNNHRSASNNMNNINNNGYISSDESDESSYDDSPSSVENYHERPNNYHESALNGVNYYDNCRQSASYDSDFASYVNGELKYADAEPDVPPEVKSFALACVTSHDDILETIKHLRSTPVLDNLVAPSPDCKFNDVYKDVGSKQNDSSSSYRGPKIASLHNLTNYNTAPRGWDQSLTYYRPITFEKPQEPIVYSDF